MPLILSSHYSARSFSWRLTVVLSIEQGRLAVVLSIEQGRVAGVLSIEQGRFQQWEKEISAAREGDFSKRFL